MAFRKKFSRTRKTSRLETRAHANRAFKRVVRQWELSTNIKCQSVGADPGPDCPNPGVVELYRNDRLRTTAHDAVRIRRITGGLWFRPFMATPWSVDSEDCNDFVARNLFDSDVVLRVGLKKVEAPEATSGISPGWNPLLNGATPADLSDYTDGKWMKLWDHMFQSEMEFHSGQQNQQFTCCSSQPSYVVPPTASGSNPGWIVPAETCSPCGDVENPSVSFNCDTVLKHPRWWRLQLNWAKPIVLKEAESLMLYFGWERFMQDLSPARPAQPAMKFVGGIRLSLES